MAAIAGRDRRRCPRQRLDRVGWRDRNRRRARPRRRGRAAPAPPRPEDAHVLKFSRAGKFLLQIGKAGKPGGNDSTTGLNRPAAIAVDATAE